MFKLDATLNLSDLFCLDEGDFIGSAEPYLWTVFFKIDGDTASVNPSLKLQGTATVVTTPGNHGNLRNRDVDAGENVPIPATIGRFTTRLRPIPLQQPIAGMTEVGGVMGAIVVLMEEDGTSGSAAASGHVALNNAVRDALNGVIPTLGFGHEEPTPAEIEAMKKKIADRVTSAISDNVGIWDWIRVFGDMDDKIGSEYFSFSHKDLEARGAGGIAIQKRFENEGDWILRGRVTAKPVDVAVGALKVTVQGVPVGVLPPVRVTGPGIQGAQVGNATLTGLLPGVYTINATGFARNPNKPTCRSFTPSPASQTRTVVAGQTATATVVYTSKRCSQED